MQFGTKEEKEDQKKAADRTVCERAFHLDREEWENNFKGIVKKCTLTRRKQKEAQESQIEYFLKKGIQEFTEGGRSAEITVDLVLQARVKLSDNKVNGPEDAIMSEMIKKLPMEKICTVARCFQGRFMDQMEPQSSWKVVKLVFLRKPDAAPTKEIKCY